MSIQCVYCHKAIKSCGSLNHRKACKIIHENKQAIFQRVEEGSGLRALSREFKVDTRSIDSFLKREGKERKIYYGPNKNSSRINESYFSDINTDEKAWVLGLIASDGNIKRNKRQKPSGFSIAQSGERGHRLIQYLASILNYQNRTYRGKTTAQDVFTISANSSRIVNDLEKYNIVCNKTKIFSFPDQLPSKYHKAFIRGYLEGDGSIGIYSNKKGVRSLAVSFVGTQKFIEKCANIIPIPCNKIIRVGENKSVSEIRWTCAKAISFCDWLFENSDLYFSYKGEKYVEYKRYRKTNPTLRQINRDKQLQAIELLKNGEKPIEVANTLGVSFQTVYKWKEMYATE